MTDVLPATRWRLQHHYPWHQAERMRVRTAKIWQSYRSLPGWVQIWVAVVLIPVNVLPFLWLDTWTGKAGAAAALFVVITNLPIMWIACGMSRAMSLPHLLAWIPLEIMLALRVFGTALSTPELTLALLLLFVNGVSLIFDALDSWRWWRGERDLPGQRRTSLPEWAHLARCPADKSPSDMANFRSRSGAPHSRRHDRPDDANQPFGVRQRRGRLQREVEENRLQPTEPVVAFMCSMIVSQVVKGRGVRADTDPA